MAHSMPNFPRNSAISTAIYLNNRSPTKALKTTLYEAWHGIIRLRLITSEYLAVMPMLIFQMMNDRNSTQNRESVSWSATEQ